MFRRDGIFQSGLRARETEVDLELIPFRLRKNPAQILQGKKQQSLGKREVFLQQPVSLEA